MDNEFINRRLLLAKEFYLQAEERSKSIDSIDKMMAIHNFHIAVEIILKAILLKNSVRTEKNVNIDFESMMAEIDKNNMTKKLAYRQELRTLNQIRGQVQHQAVEPPQSSVDDYRVITRKFLEFAYTEYFDSDFLSLSRISLINDSDLRKILERAKEKIFKQEYENSLIISIIAFKLVSESIFDSLPNEKLQSGSSTLAISNLRRGSRAEQSISGTFKDIFSRIKKAEKLSVLLGSGISLSNLKRFENTPFEISFNVLGTPLIRRSTHSNVTQEDSEWSVDFVTSTVIRWQQQGLNPAIQKRHEPCLEYMNSHFF